MTLQKLEERKVLLQGSLQNIQQSFHIVTGHLQEVDFQISEIEKELQELEDCPATMDNLANTVETTVE